MRKRSVLSAAVAALFAFGSAAPGGSPAPAAEDGRRERSERAAFRVSTFADGLDRPWGAAFLPDGRLLVTEQPGRMRVVDRGGRVSPPLAGVPPVAQDHLEGGLLDVALAPDFAETREVYVCHGARAEGGILLRLSRARLSPDAAALEGAAAILDAGPAEAEERRHFGCRIAFGPRDGKLYLSTGERDRKPRAQRLDDLAGKVLRLERDGRPAEGNPFLGRPDARPEVFSYGHRNPQGLAFNPWTGSLWEAEFGPLGGDEVNVIRPGANYGWPLATHGLDNDGSVISELRSAPGMEDPIRVWTPVISPSGIAFYTGDAFPGWRGSLFLAALNPPGLVRLSTEGDRVAGEERLLTGLVRMRHVVQGPDGRLYVLTQETEGRILRLDPTP
jgi:aldose sugar dehydrogenase